MLFKRTVRDKAAATPITSNERLGFRAAAGTADEQLKAPPIKNRNSRQCLPTLLQKNVDFKRNTFQRDNSLLQAVGIATILR